MATATGAGGTAAPHADKARAWLKKLGVAGGAIIALFVIIKLIGSPWSSGGSGEWVTVARATCSPTWNNDRGWCTVVKDAAKGTYRVIPRYKSFQLGITDGSSVTVPPYGLDLYANWKEHEDFIEEVLRTAHKKGSRNYGALIVRVGNTDVVEALNASRASREFEVAKDGTEIAVNVNITPFVKTYQGNQGQLAVEVQRLD